MFVLVLVLTTAWRILVAAKLDVCYDEGYYHFWSLHPQLSYLDHPPLIAWAMYLSGLMFGDSVWTVRIWPILAGTVFVLVGRALACTMFGKAAANRAGVFLALVPAFAGNGVLMTPDALFAVCWAVGVFAAWKSLQAPTAFSSWWLLVGFSTGLGLLSKYNMVLFLLGLGLLWLVSPSHRKSIAVGALICGTMGLVFFLPVIIWNAEHHWMSFALQLSHGLAGKPSTVFRHLSAYAGSLLLIATPLLGLLAFWSSARGIRSREFAPRFCAVFLFVVAGFFAISALKARVEPNWPMLAFFSGVILVARDWPEYASRTRRATLIVLAICCGCVAVYPLLPAQFPLAIGGHSLDMKRMREFSGGPELAAAVQAEKAEKNLDFVYVSSHQILGRLSFYAPELRPLLCPTREAARRYPWIDTAKWAGRRALIVSTTESNPQLQSSFRDVEYLGSLEIPYKRNLSDRFYLFLGNDYFPNP